MEQSKKNAWIAPQIQRYGTFEDKTRCDKQLGENDGFTFMGQAIVCAS